MTVSSAVIAGTVSIVSAAEIALDARASAKRSFTFLMSALRERSTSKKWQS
jgi:hypothetical protein